MIHEETVFGAMPVEKSFERDMSRLEEIVKSAEFRDLVHNILDLLKANLQEVCKRDNAVIVIGGKSKILLEMMLNQLASDMNLDSRLSYCISHRIELDDQQNRNLYGEATTTQIAQGQRDVAPILPDKMSTLEKPYFIFLEDHTNGLQKAGKVLQTFATYGREGEYVVLTRHPFNYKEVKDEPEEIWVSAEIQEPPYRVNKKVTILTQTEKIATFFSYLSRRISNQVDIEQNGQFLDNGNVAYMKYEELSEKMQESFKRLKAITHTLQKIIEDYK